MAGTRAPYFPVQLLTDTGAPAAAYQLFTYYAGTTTKIATYSDVNLTVANANPIILDSGGRAEIFLAPGSYKFVLALPTDTDPPGAALETWDNLSHVPPSSTSLDINGTPGVDVLERDLCYLSDGSGGLTAGLWYKADADNTYSSITAKVIGFAVADYLTAADGLFRVAGSQVGFTGLTAGDTYYVSATAGAVTNSAPTNARVVGMAESTVGIAMSPFAGVLPAVSGSQLTGVLRPLDQVITSVGNIGTGEDTIASTTIPAGKLATNGDSVRCVWWGATTSNANTKDVQVRVIEGVNDTSILDVRLTASEAGHFAVEAIIMRNAATTFRSLVRASVGPANTAVTFSGNKVTTDNTATWANAVEIRLTGEATTSSDIHVDGGVLYYSIQ